MMKPYIKGKTASTNPRSLIHPRVSKVLVDSPMSCLWHHSTSQLYYGFLNVYGWYTVDRDIFASEIFHL